MQGRPWQLGRRILGATAALFLLTGFSLDALFAPQADLWPRWQAHDESSDISVDHRPWDRLLERYRKPGSDGIARFAYGQVTAADREALERYIATLAGMLPTMLSRAQQFAYWVNLYNALTIKVVLDAGIPDSIRDIDISPGLFADGPWDRKLVTIAGEGIALNDIEHRILRPIWKDPRVHYAVNCASLGCPNLPRIAFTAENTEKLLEDGARAYVNHPRGAALVDGLLHVSSIYVWFSDDFGGEKGVLRHLAAYARPDLAEKIRGVSAIAEHSYDWRLNAIEGDG